MMKTFTQKLLACVAMLALIGVNADAQTFVVVNSGGTIDDFMVIQGTIGLQDVTDPVTGDLQIGDDGVEGDSNGDGMLGTTTDACEAITTDVSGKIALVDRGECSFFVKGEFAEAAGAIAVLVCNNRDEDPIAMGPGQNGEGTDIGIPMYMAAIGDCELLKAAMANGTVNITIEEREPDCPPVMYDPEVFWGQEEGQGDFSVPLADAGWESVNLEPLDRDDVQWVVHEDCFPLFGQFFGSGTPMESPSCCNGTAQFSFVGYSIGDNPNPGAPPYTQYSAELISPIMDCTDKDFVILEYYQAYNRLNNFSRFGWSTDGGQTWVEQDIEHLGEINTTVDIRKVTVPLPQFENQANCRVKFIAFGDFYYWNIDDVTLRSEEIRDIRANPDWFAMAPNYIAPYSQADEIPFLIDIRNIGNTSLDVEVVVDVTKDGTSVHSQTLNYGTITPDSLAENSPFPDTYTPDAGPGTYTITYTANSATGDTNEDNNTQTVDFILEEDGVINTMSKLPIDYANLGNWGIGGQSNRSYGAYYKFPTGKTYQLNSITTGVSQDEDTPAIEGFLLADIFTWIDLDEDQAVQPDERVKIGTGRAIILEDGTYTIDITDAEDEDSPLILELNDGEAILAMIHQSSLNDGITWRARAISPATTNDRYNILATEFAYDSLGIENYGCFEATGSSPDDIEERVFTKSNQLTYYTPIELESVSSTNDFDASINLEVFPNPTSDVLNVNFAFENTVDNTLIKILDSTGKFVKARSYDNLSNKQISFDVSDFNPGQYTVRIQSENGFTTKSFIVVR